MSKRTLRIVSWNVNGIRAVSKKGFIDWFSKDSPDILCLQETKAYPEQLGDELISPRGYKSFWNNPEKKGYAGVCIYTEKEPLSVEKDFSRSGFDTEGRILILYYNDFLLLNVYFPNGRMNEERLKYKLEFYDRFLKFVDSLKNRNIIICGDLNTAHNEIDLSRPGPNSMFSGFLPEERKWVDKFISHGYVDTFRHFEKAPGHYTWWDQKSRSREKNVGWRIDYFFVTPEMLKRVKKAFILPEVQGSDHCPVGIELSQEKMEFIV